MRGQPASRLKPSQESKGWTVCSRVRGKAIGMGLVNRQDGHSPVVATQGEGTLRRGRCAGLEVVDAALVDDHKA